MVGILTNRSVRVLLAAGFLCAAATACGPAGDGGAETPEVVERLPSPIFDGLDIGMTRAQVMKVHRIRPSRPVGGRNLRVWLYEVPGRYSVQLTFSGTSRRALLRRIDVRYGRSAIPADRFIARFERRFGEPDSRRRPALIPAYGDASHDQLDTIWTDPTRYVSLTEQVPKKGHRGRTAYFLILKKREITAAGPPTGYVPPPPPEGEDEDPSDPFL